MGNSCGKLVGHTLPIKILIGSKNHFTFACDTPYLKVLWACPPPLLPGKGFTTLETKGIALKIILGLGVYSTSLFLSQYRCSIKQQARPRYE